MFRAGCVDTCAEQRTRLRSMVPFLWLQHSPIPADRTVGERAGAFYAEAATTIDGRTEGSTDRRMGERTEVWTDCSTDCGRLQQYLWPTAALDMAGRKSGRQLLLAMMISAGPCPAGDTVNRELASVAGTRAAVVRRPHPHQQPA